MRIFLYIYFVVIILQGCKVEPGKTIASDNFEFVELADGVYSCIHKFGGKATCNVGVVDNGKETLIFDSFLSPAVAQELSDAIAEIGLSPVKYVVNSHFHNDHIRGNQVFPYDVKIISTTATSKLIEEEEPLQIAFEKENAPARYTYYDSLYLSFAGDRQSREYKQILMWRPYYETLSNSHVEVKTRVPDMFVDSMLNIEGPDRKILLISKGQGHTDSDLILYLPDDKILFSGDLVFNECHPYVAHGNISKWKTWLDFMNTLEVTTVMPGHGQLGTAELFDQMKSYLQDLEISAENLIKNEASLESIDTIPVPEKYETWWFDRFYAYNLNFAYESALAAETE
ncbi:MAG: MBL fold metallo-hydrolase [Eudoraea sp.]|nr:MBL fold metallo-hydrolase [Eudoraea sp.]NNK31328.1 MBL fold metallo-hydrolase [Flavobacteriaceae bacterium]